MPCVAAICYFYYCDLYLYIPVPLSFSFWEGSRCRKSQYWLADYMQAFSHLAINCTTLCRSQVALMFIYIVNVTVACCLVLKTRLSLTFWIVFNDLTGNLASYLDEFISLLRVLLLAFVYIPHVCLDLPRISNKIWNSSLKSCDQL